MTSRFLHEVGDSIQLLDFQARCVFKTMSSISFALHVNRDGGLFEIGFCDLHYAPEDQVCPVHLRISLPRTYHDSLDDIVQSLFRAFAIDAETIFEMHFLWESSSATFTNRTDHFFTNDIHCIVSPDDIGAFTSIMGEARNIAVVHHITSSLSDILTPHQPIHSQQIGWEQQRLNFRELLRDLLTEDDKRILNEELIESFMRNNRCPSIYPEKTPFFTLPDWPFRQSDKILQRVPNCSAWWRFSAVGYDEFRTKALVHVERVRFTKPLTSVRFFALLRRETPQWSIATTMPCRD